MDGGHDIGRLRQRRLLKGAGVGQRHFFLRHPLDRRIDIVEGFFKAAETSAPTPKERHPSSTMTARFVRRNDSRTGCMSSGRSERKSTISASIPCWASCSAACSDTWSILE
jgi:hypothetical protein